MGVFVLATASELSLESIQPHIQWELSPWVKRPGCEANYSPPSGAEIKNVWNYTSTPPVRLHGLVLS